MLSDPTSLSKSSDSTAVQIWRSLLVKNTIDKKESKRSTLILLNTSLVLVLKANKLLNNVLSRALSDTNYIIFGFSRPLNPV